MGRYTGPKGRINRRLGFQVFENNGAVKAFERRDSPPGMAQRRRKLTNYGLGMREKQKIKYYYGFRERQLVNYYAEARRLKGNTGEHLLILCERRLDNIVRRAGFTSTRPQARQGIAHGHFQLNGRKVTIPSILVNPGDVITVRNRPNLKSMYKELIESGNRQPVHWIDFDPDSLTATVKALPTFEDVSLPVDVGQVVTFLSR